MKNWRGVKLTEEERKPEEYESQRRDTFKWEGVERSRVRGLKTVQLVSVKDIFSDLQESCFTARTTMNVGEKDD